MIIDYSSEYTLTRKVEVYFFYSFMKVAVLFGVFLLQILALQAQKDWANFGRYEQANKEIINPVRAVFIGNSITEGWFNADPVFFTSNKYLGRGIGGQTTSEMLVRFRQDVINVKPKAVVILAGTNDIAQNNGYISIENIMGNLISMCELAKSHKIKVFLCSVLPVKKYPWRQEVNAVEQIAALNMLMQEYCKKNRICYVDYFSVLADEEGGLPKKYADDGVHPNLTCYKLMEEIIYSKLKHVNKQ